LRFFLLLYLQQIDYNINRKQVIQISYYAKKCISFLNDYHYSTFQFSVSTLHLSIISTPDEKWPVEKTFFFYDNSFDDKNAIPLY